MSPSARLSITTKGNSSEKIIQPSSNQFSPISPTRPQRRATGYRKKKKSGGSIKEKKKQKKQFKKRSAAAQKSLNGDSASDTGSEPESLTSDEGLSEEHEDEIQVTA